MRAPCDGRITALDIASGEFAATGDPLFTIIDTEYWYAIGNFRETDLAGMEPGQRATVYVMAQPSRTLRGQVDSLGWGVASDVSATVERAHSKVSCIIAMTGTTSSVALIGEAAADRPSSPRKRPTERTGDNGASHSNYE